MSITDVRAPRTREQLRAWVLHDLAAHGLTEWRDTYRTVRPVVHYQLLRRRAEYWTYGSDHRVPASMAARRSVWLATKTRRLGRRLNLDVPLGTAGPGLFLVPAPDGAWSEPQRAIRVHPASRLGSDCTLHAGVVVDCDPATGEPSRLGDHCLLGEGAVLLGAVLGDRIEVVADAFVADDFGDDLRLSGWPAQVVGITDGTGHRRDGRRTELTTAQSASARSMQASGLPLAAIADAFWVSNGAVAAALRTAGCAPDVDTSDSNVSALINRPCLHPADVTLAMGLGNESAQSAGLN